MWGKLTKSNVTNSGHRRKWRQSSHLDTSPALFSRGSVSHPRSDVWGGSWEDRGRGIYSESHGLPSQYLSEPRHATYIDMIISCVRRQSLTVCIFTNISIISGHPFSQWFNLSFLMRLSLVNLKYVFSLWHLHLAFLHNSVTCCQS